LLLYGASHRARDLHPVKQPFRWCRISLLALGLRLTPKGRFRLFLWIYSAAIVLIWALVAGRTIWDCETHNSWKEDSLPICISDKSNPISQLGVFFYLMHDKVLTLSLAIIPTDLLIAYAPIRLVWRTKFPRTLKIRLTLSFSSIFACTAAEGWRRYAVLHGDKTTVALVILAEATITLFVTNFVIVFAVWPSWSDRETTDQHQFSTLQLETTKGGMEPTSAS
jgi:hypothetical protein